MNRLTEEEWSDVLASLPENLDETAEGWELSLVRRTVERIVAARLASVEALAADWQANGNSRELGDPRADVWHKCAEQLLSVLGSDAHTEQKGTGDETADQ